MGQRAGLQAPVRFSTANAGTSDPGDNTEAVGDIDAVKATALGMKNLERVAGMLLTATTTKTGDPYDELTEVYGRFVGAVDYGDESCHAGRGWISLAAETYRPIRSSIHSRSEGKASGSREIPARQCVSHAAVHDQARDPSADLADRRDRACANRAELRDEFALQTARIDRLVEQAAIDGSGAYTPVDFLAMSATESGAN